MRRHSAPPSAEFLRLRATLEAGDTTQTMGLADERRAFQCWADGLTTASEVRIEVAAGLPVRGTEWIRPTVRASELGAVFYLHGGGFRVGSPATARAITTHLSAKSGIDVLSAAYPLAPEASIGDMVASLAESYRALRSARPGAGIVLAGDSAGAYLALSLLDVIARAGEDVPAALVLFSPLTSLDVRGGDRQIRDPMLGEEMLATVRRDAVAPTPRAPRPPVGVPMLVQFGRLERLASSIEEFVAENARDDVRVEEWSDAFHVWHLFAGSLPEADAAIASASSFVRAALR